MIDVTQDIISLSDFRQKSAEHTKRLKASGPGSALVLTVNGRSDLVVVTAAEYQRLWELADRMEEVLAIRQGMDEADAGLGLPLGEAFEQIKRKHGLRDSHRADGTDGDR